MAEVGDRVQVATTKVGQVVREGVITEVSGPLLRIRWSTGEESSVIPAWGSLMVIDKGTSRRPVATKNATTRRSTRGAPHDSTDTKATPAKKTAVKAGSRSEATATKATKATDSSTKVKATKTKVKAAKAKPKAAKAKPKAAKAKPKAAR